MHADLHLAVQTAFVGKCKNKRFAHVYRTILAVHRLADRSVLPAQNAHTIRLALGISVLIRVLIAVAKTLIAKLSIIARFALARVVLPEIHSPDAIQFHVIISLPRNLYTRLRRRNLMFVNTVFTAPIEAPITPVVTNPCVPSPCGPYSQCRDANGVPSCSCLPNYIGGPPNCHPECTINAECQSIHACIRQKCQDPCPGSCGLDAECHVTAHIPICTCLNGYTGDPFLQCLPMPPRMSSASYFLFHWLEVLVIYDLYAFCSSSSASISWSMWSITLWRQCQMR